MKNDGTIKTILIAIAIFLGISFITNEKTIDFAKNKINDDKTIRNLLLAILAATNLDKLISILPKEEDTKQLVEAPIEKPAEKE